MMVVLTIDGNTATRSHACKLTSHPPPNPRTPRHDHARAHSHTHAHAQAIMDGKIKKGDVLIIRNEGPKGAPGMPEMLSPGAALIGAGLGCVRSSRSYSDSV